MQAIYWLNSHSEPPAIDVSGAWQWEGKALFLRQKQGGSSVIGTGLRCGIHGVVSGDKVYLLFNYYSDLGYSAVLTMDHDETLKGSYLNGEVMGEESKTSPMTLVKTGPAPLMPSGYKAKSTKTIEVADFEDPSGVYWGPDYQAVLSNELVRRLIELKRFAAVTQPGYADPGAKAPDLRITGVVTAENAGVRSFFIPYGLGNAQLKAQVKFIDVATGNVKWEQEVISAGSGGYPITATLVLAKEIENIVKSKDLF